MICSTVIYYKFREFVLFPQLTRVGYQYPVLFFPIRVNCLSQHTEFGLMDSSSLENLGSMSSCALKWTVAFTAYRIKGPLDHISDVGRRTDFSWGGDSGATVKMHQW